MQGSIRTLPVVAAAFEFKFLGGSMGSVVGERFVRGIQACMEQHLPFICFSASGGVVTKLKLLTIEGAQPGGPTLFENLPLAAGPRR